MVQKLSQHRFLTVAGSAALVAIAAFGVWKWSKSGNAWRKKMVSIFFSFLKHLKLFHLGKPKSKKETERQVDKDQTTSQAPTQDLKAKDITKQYSAAEEDMVKAEFEHATIIKQEPGLEVVSTEHVVVKEGIESKENTEDVQSELSQTETTIEVSETITTTTTTTTAAAAAATATTDVPVDVKLSTEKALDEIILDLANKEPTAEEEEYILVEEEAAPKKQESQSCATSSGDETGVWTPEHEPEVKANTPNSPATNQEYIWKADAYVPPTTTTTTTTNNNNNNNNSDSSSNNNNNDISLHETEASNWDSPVDTGLDAMVSSDDSAEASIMFAPAPTTGPRPLSSDAPEFIPRSTAPRRATRRRLTRLELIQQQRQNYTPQARARCSHWPCCTNKNCKFWHPCKDCREGEDCPFGTKCMFIHPSDYLEPVRGCTSRHQEE
ncbi:hypothetical protein BD770DRAFT_382237 [Pilaira anomala]|nr:hypothetical protein BD770DRAFT_382237 [Pilaira anomala]